MSQQSQVAQLIQGLQLTDPKLYAALMAMISDLNAVYEVTFPTVAAVSTPEAPAPAPLDAFSFAFEFKPTFLKLTWDSSDPAIRAYEIRHGASWNTGEFIVRTSNKSALLEPVTAGPHTYWLKTLNSEFTYSANAIQLDLSVDPPNTPSVTASVIDNNVLLSWTDSPGSFGIDYFKIYKDGVLMGTQRGTFSVVFEQISGIYTYGVVAYDYADNPSSMGAVVVSVNQPPDYDLVEDFLSTFTGTLSGDVELIEGKIYFCHQITNWRDHFLFNSWASPADQVAAGYPLYLQPMDPTGDYTETIDFGAAIDAVIVNVVYTLEQIGGAGIGVSGTIEGSLDGTTWSTPQAMPSAFFDSVRYVRIHFDFTDDDITIGIMSNLHVLLNTKQATDSGNYTIAYNPPGVPDDIISFNLPFKDVDSITVTANYTSPIIVIYDFVDAPFPTSFKVLAFDDAGTRIDHTVGLVVSWKARGVI